MVTPTTSWPASSSSAAATVESTPPDRAASTLTRTPRTSLDRRRARRAARRRRRRRWSPTRARAATSRRRGRSGDAHRREHVRRLLGTRRARRGGAGHDPLGLEQEQQRLGVDPLDAEVADPGQHTGAVAVAHRGLGSRPARVATRPSARRSRSAAIRALVVVTLGDRGVERGGEPDDAGHVGGARSAAALLAPAEHQRADRRVLAHDQRTDPLRSTELVPRHRDQVRAAAAVPDRSSQAAACTASVCTGTRGTSGSCARTTAATASRSLMTPVSLFASITETTDDVRADVRQRRRQLRPGRPGRSVVHRRRPGHRAPATVSSTAWCSTAEQTGTPGRGGMPPLTAWLSASVPPEVNTTSPGAQPSAAATRSRASSTARTASRARRCEPDGLP